MGPERGVSVPWASPAMLVGGDGGDVHRRAIGRTVGRMVRRVARRMPFEALCLPQSMAAQWMLRRRGVSARLWIGVRRPGPGRPVDYHAWLTVDGESVIGGPAGAYAPLPVADAAGGRWGGAPRVPDATVTTPGDRSRRENAHG